MRIAIDARGINWYRGTGIGTYTEKLLENLINIDSENYYHIYWSGDGYEKYKQENTRLLMASKKHHRFFEQYFFPYNLSKDEIDLYHIPQNGIGLSEDIRCKSIVTIHDLIPYVMPETVGKGYLTKFLKEMPKVVANSSAILTVSEWSKKDILKFFPIDENKIYVTPLAADSKYKPLDKEKCRAFLQEQYNITKPFILYIGGFSSRKNVRSLIIAFSKLYKKLDKEYNLVIVGANRDDGQKLTELSTNLDLSSKIIFTGFAPEDHLPILYSGSEVFVYPSLYEGFGLPPLEAMNCGTPVITSKVTSIPEVVGDAGMLIDPNSAAELMDAIEKVLCSDKIKAELRVKGLKRASEFSWKNTSKKTLEAYTEVYNYLETNL